MARRPVRRSVPARRRTTWATHQSTETFAAANDQHVVNLLDQYQAAAGSIAGITCGRTLIHLAITSTVAAGDRLGVGLVRGQNTDVGTNVVGAPNVFTNYYEDWAWLEQYDASTSGGGPLYGKWGSNVLTFDVKAKRRLPELQMSWNLHLKSSVTATWQLFARTLVILP